MNIAPTLEEKTITNITNLLKEFEESIALENEERAKNHSWVAHFDLITFYYWLKNDKAL